MSSIEELVRKADVYREILKTIPAESVDREGYARTLASIESEIEALEPKAPLPEKVEDVAVPSEPEAKAEGTELEVEEVPLAQSEKLILPKEKSEAKKTESKTESQDEAPEPVDRIAQVMGVLRAVQKFLNTPVFGEKKTN